MNPIRNISVPAPFKPGVGIEETKAALKNPVKADAPPPDFFHLSIVDFKPESAIFFRVDNPHPYSTIRLSDDPVFIHGFRQTGIKPLLFIERWFLQLVLLFQDWLQVFHYYLFSSVISSFALVFCS